MGGGVLRRRSPSCSRDEIDFIGHLVLTRAFLLVGVDQGALAGRRNGPIFAHCNARVSAESHCYAP